MGNYSSRCVARSTKSKTAKLIDSDGNLKQVSLPVKAAELMLEEPGYVISPAHELKRTSRVIAMRADDELLPRKLYLLVPLTKLNSKISKSELEILESAFAACEKKKRSSRKKRHGAKVLPAVPPAELRKEGEGEGESEVKVLGGIDVGLHGYRFVNYRQWTPVLEPISEDF